MAKGTACPGCGELTFHVNGAVRECSNAACKAVGWTDGPGAPGSGKGSKCKVCGSDTFRRLYERAKKFTLDYCTTCEAVAIRT